MVTGQEESSTLDWIGENGKLPNLPVFSFKPSQSVSFSHVSRYLIEIHVISREFFFFYPASIPFLTTIFGTIGPSEFLSSLERFLFFYGLPLMTILLVFFVQLSTFLIVPTCYSRSFDLLICARTYSSFFHLFFFLSSVDFYYISPVTEQHLLPLSFVFKVYFWYFLSPYPSTPSFFYFLLFLSCDFLNYIFHSYPFHEYFLSLSFFFNFISHLPLSTSFELAFFPVSFTQFVFPLSFSFTYRSSNSFNYSFFPFSLSQ